MSEQRENQADTEILGELLSIVPVSPGYNLYRAEAIEAAGYKLVETMLKPESVSTVMTIWAMPEQPYLLGFVKSGDDYHYAATLQKKRTT